MSGYKNFAVVGAGQIGGFVIRQLLTDKAAGTVNDVVVLTRQASLASASDAPTDQQSQGSNTTVDPAAKLITVDYSNKESIKKALTGVDVVISTIPATALDVKPGIAEAAKEVGVKLFVPSEFGGTTEGATEGQFGAKANVQEQLKAIGILHWRIRGSSLEPVSTFIAVLSRCLFSRRAGTWVLISRPERRLSVVTAQTRFRSPPDLTLHDTFHMC
jgi:hypothetical protein